MPQQNRQRARKESGTKPLPRSLLIVTIAAACLVPLAFSLYTDQVWEDSLITLRHSENLLRGDGLVYNPGERVHGFTSPINVLLLAVSSFATGQDSYMATIWLYRLMCIAAFAASAVLITRRLWQETPSHPLICAAMFLLLYVLDAKAVAFTSNGMETGFMLLFLAGMIALAATGAPESWRTRGICWGGLMWSRPDGCVYIAAMALAELALSPGVRGTLIRSYLKSALACTLIYLPWFVWAWAYYGSPIPQTVLAKGPADIGVVEQMLRVFDRLFELVMRISSLVFEPSYGWLETRHWVNDRLAHWVLYSLSRAAGLFCVFYWILPVPDRLGRIASLSFLCVTMYVATMQTPYPWYLPPAALLGLVTVVRGIITLSDLAVSKYQGRTIGGLHPVAIVALALLATGQAVLFGWYASEARFQQAVIETDNRRLIGLWLGEHGRPGEAVFLEPLGYIGYFSRMRMVDWPGLVAPQVVQLRRQYKVNPLGAIIGLRPEWVVLRNREYEGLGDGIQPFNELYVQAAAFDTTEMLRLNNSDLRKPQASYDAQYRVFRRRDVRPEDFE